MMWGAKRPILIVMVIGFLFGSTVLPLLVNDAAAIGERAEHAQESGVTVSSDEAHYGLRTENLTVSINMTDGFIRYFPRENPGALLFTLAIVGLDIYDQPIVTEEELPTPAYHTKNEGDRWQFRTEGFREQDVALIMQTTMDLYVYAEKGNDNPGQAPVETPNPTRIADNGQTRQGPPSTPGEAGQGAPNDTETGPPNDTETGPPNGTETGPPDRENGASNSEPFRDAVSLELWFREGDNNNSIKIDYVVEFHTALANAEVLTLVHALNGTKGRKMPSDIPLSRRGPPEDLPINIGAGGVNDIEPPGLARGRVPGIDFITDSTALAYFSWARYYTTGGENDTVAVYETEVTTGRELIFCYNLSADPGDPDRPMSVVHDPEVGLYAANIEAFNAAQVTQEIRRFVMEHYRSIALGLAIGISVIAVIVGFAHRRARRNALELVRLDANRYYQHDGRHGRDD